MPLRLSRPIEVTLSTGYQFVNESSNGDDSTSTGGGKGAYGTIIFSTTF